MEANSLTETAKYANGNGNGHANGHANGVTSGKSHIAVLSEPELRAQGMPGVYVSKMVVETRRGPEFIDITDTVQDLLSKTGVKEGNIFVYSRHTTCGIVIQEHEPLLIQDMYKKLEQLASPAEDYHHNNFDIRTVNMCDDECANGHAHCQHLFIGCSVQLPVMDGHMALGRWQRVFILEMDRPRTREIIVQVMGVKG